MVILNPEAPTERREEILARAQELIVQAGGQVHHVNEWGRRKIAYPIAKQADGVYAVITCTSTAEAIDEIARVFAISKDVVLRAIPIRLDTAAAERSVAGGAPVPVDDRPDEPRPPRAGRGGRRRSG